MKLSVYRLNKLLASYRNDNVAEESGLFTVMTQMSRGQESGVLSTDRP